MRILKQSTAANVMVLMVDDTDHVTGKTGLTLTITASKDGGAFASITPTVTERGTGWYNLALTTSHTDTLGDLAIHVTGTDADPSDFYAWVVVRHLSDLTFPATSGRSLTVDTSGRIDIGAWVGGTPNALQTGRVDSYVGAMAGGVIADATFQSGAIDDDAIATSAITEIQTGLATATALSTHDTDIKARLPTSLVSGRMDSYVGAMGADVVTASAIAAGAITDSEAPALANLDATVSSRAPETDTNDIQGRLPTALIGGRMDSSVGAMASDVITAAAIAAGAITSSEAPALSNLDATVSSRAATGDAMTLTSGERGSIADAVFDEAYEGTETLRRALRFLYSVLVGESAGGGTTTVTFRDAGDTKDRVTATVDSNGNRTAMSLDLT